MAETKVKGLKIKYSEDFIFIENAYQINNKEKMEQIIQEVINKMDFCSIKRTMKSITREWAGKNRLYRLHIFKKKNTNIQIKNNNKIQEIFYCLIGFRYKRRKKNG